MLGIAGRLKSPLHPVRDRVRSLGFSLTGGIERRCARHTLQHLAILSGSSELPS